MKYSNPTTLKQAIASLNEKYEDYSLKVFLNGKNVYSGDVCGITSNDTLSVNVFEYFKSDVKKELVFYLIS